MTYSNNVSNKKLPQVQSNLAYAGHPPALQPIAGGQSCCGSIPVFGADHSLSGGQQSTPFVPGGQQTLPHDSSFVSTQVFPASLPVMPAGAAVTASSATVPHVPSVPGAIAVQPGSPFGDQVPSTLQNTFFTPGFLRTQIGRRVRVEFLLGTNLLTDRTGTLVAVGASYIVLRLVDSDDLMMCDIFSIKFVTIIL